MSNLFFIKLLQYSFPGSTHNLFGSQLDLFIIPTKPFRTDLAFLSFKGLTQAYTVETFITHNKYLTHQFLEENDPISAKSAAEILSLNLA